jgi:hypothetical protein
MKLEATQVGVERNVRSSDQRLFGLPRIHKLARSDCAMLAAPIVIKGSLEASWLQKRMLLLLNFLIGAVLG